MREEVFRLASDRHWIVRELTQRRATLEDVFVEITHSTRLIMMRRMNKQEAMPNNHAEHA